MRQRLKSTLLSRNWSPAYKVILATISRNRWLVGLVFCFNLFAALFEGSTFGIIFLALGILTSDQSATSQKNVLSNIPGASALLGHLSQGQLFVSLIALAVALQVLRSIMQYLGNVSAGYLANRIKVQMTERVFNQVMQLSFACASHYKVGDLLSYVNSSGTTVQRQISLLNEVLLNSLVAIAYAAVVIAISPPLSAVTLVLSASFLAIQKYLLPRIRQTSKDIVQVSVSLSKELTESIQALRLIHTFARQRATVQRIRNLQQDLVPLLDRQLRLLNLNGPLGQILTILIVGILLIAGFLLLNRSAQWVLPSLIVFMSAFNRLATQCQVLVGIANQFANNSGNLARLNEILSPEDKQFTRWGGIAFEKLHDAIAFDCVTLRYASDTQDPALQDLSFQMKKGTTTALVGASGAGKSSIADLLIALYEPTAGAILVDGLDLRDYSLESWRDNLGVVSQDTFIFNTTILDNIRYGLPTASADDAVEAAKRAQAHKFISQLPDGYETIVGERGYRLSGGQRQRVALARAILKQPEILILDEATSALDSQSERLVQEALNQFQRDRTVLVIAHRLSTVVNADEIIVLERGRIVERGNHQTLLALGGLYAEYWHLQSQGSELSA